MTLLGVAISKVVGYGQKVPEEPKEIPAEIPKAEKVEVKKEPAPNTDDIFNGDNKVEAFADGPLAAGSQETAMILGAIKSKGVKPPSASILIGGCGEVVGTSCIAAGVALELARRSSGRVALVDANTHSPHLANVLEYDGKPGMVDVLCGKKNIEDALCYSQADNLHALVMNPHKAAELELEGSVVTERLSRVVGQLIAACEYVVIDAGNIDEELPVRSVFGKLSGTVLALRYGVTQASVAKTRSRIEGAGGQILGAIMIQSLTDSNWIKSRR